ncbi:MAG: hypothetical protein GY754_33885 [bacterium]|nr:hypothetical protein [bacterium]
MSKFLSILMVFLLIGQSVRAQEGSRTIEKPGTSDIEIETKDDPAKKEKKEDKKNDKKDDSKKTPPKKDPAPLKDPPVVRGGSHSSDSSCMPGARSADGCSNIGSGCGNIDNEFALVVFLVLGIFVILIWVGYAFLYIYDIIFNDVKINPWFQMEAQGTYIIPQTRTDELENVERTGYLANLKLSMGMDYMRNFDMGLVAEIGYHDFFEIGDNGTDSRFRNGYGMIGPAIYIGFTGRNRSYFFVELLGGTSIRQDIGIIASAKLGFSFCLADHLILGVHFGSLFSNIKASSGIITTADKFNLITGVSVGARL